MYRIKIVTRSWLTFVVQALVGYCVSKQQSFFSLGGLVPGPTYYRLSKQSLILPMLRKKYVVVKLAYFCSTNAPGFYNKGDSRCSYYPMTIEAIF
jgi:hypothetical protein